MHDYVETGVVRFIAYGCEECPDTGALHYQAYACFSTLKSHQQVCKLFPESYVKPMYGTLSQNEAYCSKESELTKLGDEPAQGDRTDLKRIRDRIESGERPMTIARTTDSIDTLQTIARHSRFFEQMHTEAEWDKRRTEGFKPPAVYLRVGEPGVGKSRYVHEQHGYHDVWKWNSNMGQFFNGYRGEPVVVFEDVQKGEIPSLGLFKQLLDGYPVVVNVKGSHAAFLARVIYITSNEEPQYWFDYPNPSHYNALMSRITSGVRVFKDRPDEVFHTSDRHGVQADQEGHSSVQEGSSP